MNKAKKRLVFVPDAAAIAYEQRNMSQQDLDNTVIHVQKISTSTGFTKAWSTDISYYCPLATDDSTQVLTIPAGKSETSIPWTHVDEVY